jgi:hypothetical protein
LKAAENGQRKASFSLKLPAGGKSGIPEIKTGWNNPTKAKGGRER